jgi:hypothetical protein
MHNDKLTSKSADKQIKKSKKSNNWLVYVVGWVKITKDVPNLGKVLSLRFGLANTNVEVGNVCYPGVRIYPFKRQQMTQL